LHDIIIIITKVNCLIALAKGELVNVLTELRDQCEALNTFILESSAEQPEAHELLEEIQAWATNRCAANNVSGGCMSEAKGFIERIGEFI
jgi:hypothetical protein